MTHKKIRWAGLGLLLFFSQGIFAQNQAGGSPCRLQQWIGQHQEQVALFFEKIDTSLAGLESVAAAIEQNDLTAAARALLEYYAQKPPVAGFDLSKSANYLKTADMMLKDQYEWGGQVVTIERDESGGIVWDSLAGTGDEQFLTLPSRQFLLLQVLQAYHQTKDPGYIEFINDYLTDWLTNQPFPADEVANFEKDTWARPESFLWMTLNAGIRVGSWVRLWQHAQDVPLRDDVRFRLLMSLEELCDFLRWHHRRTGNFKVTEMTAIVETAIAFPEFVHASDWLAYGLQELENEMSLQFYPDGAQKELAYHYNLIVVRRLNHVENLARLNGVPVPESYLEKVENLYRYMAVVMKPDGYGPLNNDSDATFILDTIRDAARRFNNSELMYIASRGAEGSWDRDSYSVVLPWAGQAIFRSGFGANDDWSYFEIGPWGIAHQHYDKLHLSVAVGGRDILVDSGRYTYVGYHDTTNPWRNYFTGSDSHNVILIDGLGQSERERQWRAPLHPSHYAVTETFAFARGEFDSSFQGVRNKDADQFKGRAAHTRSVLYVPPFGWIVVDTIDTDRPRTIDVLWRFHPECTVQTDGLRVFTRDEGTGNLMILPAGEYDLDLNIVKGRNPPEVQGWYSELLGIKVPNPVAIYNGRIEQSTTLVWWLMPRHAEEEPGTFECSYILDAESQKVTFSGRRGDHRLEAVIPIRQGHPEVVLKTGE